MQSTISYIRKILFITLVFVVASGYGQTHKLANSYFVNGEYEKAAELYLKLYQKSPRSTTYFNRYIQALLNSEQYNGAEKAIRKEIKKHPERTDLYVTLGSILEQEGDEEGGEKWYKRAIESLSPNFSSVSRMANSFVRQRKEEYAIATYRKGEKMLKKPHFFAYNIANIYRAMGDKMGMIQAYLDYLEFQPNSLTQVKQNFSRYLGEEDMDDLEMELYARLQEHPQSNVYPKVLEWMYVQRGQYDKALLQATALDKRMQGNGEGVFSLGRTALLEGQYDAALEAFDYIIKEKGTSNSFYIDAVIAALDTRKKQITSNPNYNREELKVLAEEYEQFLDAQGINGRTAGFVLDLVDLYTFYLHEYKRPTELLGRFVEYRGVDPRLLAKAKIKLADLYLMQGNRWDATLLYSQVDKAFREAPLGEDARYKNALLAYYFGDFAWAQEQFDILKRATSRMISNDAIDRSVFIMENTGLDSSFETMRRFAHAELLLFQRKHKAAIATLDSLLVTTPKHELADDALFVKAKVYEDLRQYDLAERYYLELIERIPEAIRTDNAMYGLAYLYDVILQQPDKALDWYEKIFVDHPDSTFAILARERYRKLRGDEI